MYRYSLLLLLFISLPLQAGVHRWVDENGHVHFSDKAPSNKKSEKIDIKVQEPKRNADQQERLRKQQYFLESQQEAREEKKFAKEQQKKRDDRAKQICLQSKAALEKHENGRVRIYNTRPDGSRYFMTNEEKQAYLVRLRQDIKMYCK